MRHVVHLSRIGFYVQTDLRKTCTLNSCQVLLIHNVNGSIGQDAALVLPGRSTIPEEVRKPSRICVCVTSCCDTRIIILQAMYYNVTLRAVRATNVAVENQLVLHILRVCLWIWVSSMQCACAILSSAACPHPVNGTIF